MGLLDKNTNSGEGQVTDCVGKAGYCEYVTDPRDGKLYKKTTLFEDVKAVQRDESLNNILNKIDKLMGNETPDDETLDDETIAKSLVTIINKLDQILSKLN